MTYLRTLAQLSGTLVVLFFIVISTHNAEAGDPAIYLAGSNPYLVLVGDTYTDPGATATDTEDGNLTSSIATSTNVNMNVAGTYYVTYLVQDASSTYAHATRTVWVMGATPNAFITGGGFNNSVEEYSINLQSDGKIIVGGAFTSYASTTRQRLVRLTTNGTVDATFSTNIGTSISSYPDAMAVQPDDKILVGGHFTEFNGNTRNYFLRLNANGTDDTTFNSNLGTGFNSIVYSIHVQPDGKILVGGSFSIFNGNSRNGLVRLNSDGTEDITFYSNLGNAFPGASLYAIKTQSDGKILVGGSFTTFASSTRNALVRLNPNGTEDTSFYSNLGTGFGGPIAVSSLIVQLDGKIVVGGYFTTLNGTTRNRLVRLNEVGTVDSTFYSNLGSGFGGTVYVLTSQPDGKILVGGTFSTFASSTRRKLARLNSDGTEDTSFYSNLGSGFDDYDVYSITVQPDEKILVGGDFTLLNGVTRRSFVRLHASGTVDIDTTQPVITILGDNPASKIRGGTYTDAGATASDAVDGNVSASISTVNNVDTNTAGTYTVVYTANDASGNYSSATRTVTVSEGGGGGSSGGGGGGAKKVKVTKEMVALAQELTKAPNLKFGTTSPYVKTLQKLLNLTGYTIAKKGPTSKGQETNSFTKGTQKALIKYQKAKKLTRTGILDLPTRTSLAQTYKSVSNASSTKPKSSTTQNTTLSALAKQLGVLPNYSLNQDAPGIQLLQKFLNQTGYTITTSGPGSKGQETTRFGPATKSALMKFQSTYGLPVTGVFDQKTKALILSGWGR